MGDHWELTGLSNIFRLLVPHIYERTVGPRPGEASFYVCDPASIALESAVLRNAVANGEMTTNPKSAANTTIT